jgi:hypothetical protein
MKLGWQASHVLAERDGAPEAEAAGAPCVRDHPLAALHHRAACESQAFEMPCTYSGRGVT